MILAYVTVTQTDGDQFEHVVELDDDTASFQIASQAEQQALEDFAGSADVASVAYDYHEWVE
jgi:hypothetical protein